MKKLLSFILALTMLLSCTVATSAYSLFEDDVLTVDEAIANYEASSGETVITNRYYFLMPDGTNGQIGKDETSAFYGEYAPSWYNEHTDTAGIFWWDSHVADPKGWAGYLPSGKDADDENVYYADVPVKVSMVVWNNGVDCGQDITQDIYYHAAQTGNVPAEYYDYPDGTENFDGMIYVINPDRISINDLSGMQTCGGKWYYYYGKGCYGTVKGGTEEDCIRDDHKHNVDVPDFEIGDVNLDGEISILDATSVQRYLAHIDELSDEQKAVADTDKNDEIGILDATMIQRLLAHIIDEF